MSFHRFALVSGGVRERHGIEGGVELADTLSPDGERLPKADLVLTNPPFGTKKGGGRPTRSDFSVTADTSNKQLAFVEHIVPRPEAGRTGGDGGT
jgi:type I restriction enzyme M protein